MAITPKLAIEKAALNDLIPYVGNAKEHPSWQVEQIANSIEQFGMNDPIAVWTNTTGGLEIVEGHGRLLACRKLGMDSVPVIRLDHLDDEARRAYVHVHNQLSMNTGFDIDKLNAEMASLPTFEWSDLGFNIGENLEDLGDIDEDEVPESAPTRCQPGDVWQLGEHRLVCGDSTDSEIVAKLMGTEVADLLLTDPPYGIDYAAKNEYLNRGDKATRITTPIKNDAFSDDASFKDFLIAAFTAAASGMRPGAAFYCWAPPGPKLRLFFDALIQGGLPARQKLEWVKNNIVIGMNDYHYKNESCLYGWKDGAPHWFAPTRKEKAVLDDDKPIEKMTKDELVQALRALTEDVESVLRFDKPARAELHPTMKPVALFCHLIRNSSQPGDVVLDVFAGSGTTMVACEEMGRKARLVEYDAHYCDVIIERYERLTGNTAERISSDG